MGFPAQTIDGATVFIVSKTNDGGETDIFTDADGREWVRSTGHSQLALVPLLRATIGTPEVIPAPKKTRAKKVEAVEEVEVELEDELAEGDE